MKTILSIVFGVSVCCLLPSNGVAADEAKPAKERGSRLILYRKDGATS
jgi:hypothetical protein